MPDNEHNTQTVNSMLPGQQGVEAEKQITGPGSEPPEPIDAEEEPGITPSPVYRALYGDHRTDTTETIIPDDTPYDKNETTPVSTITETPRMQSETLETIADKTGESGTTPINTIAESTTSNNKPPETPVAETPGLERPDTTHKPTADANNMEDDFIIKTIAAHESN